MYSAYCLHEMLGSFSGPAHIYTGIARAYKSDLLIMNGKKCSNSVYNKHTVN